MQEVQVMYDPDDLLFTYQMCLSDAKRHKKENHSRNAFIIASPQQYKLKNKSSSSKTQRRRYKVEPRKAVLHCQPKIESSAPQSPAPYVVPEPVIVAPQQPVLRNFENHIPCAFSIIRRGNLPSFDMPL